ncbi:MAG: hypothetical protein R6W78_04680 [Bacteroidales bacterium]
MISKEDKILGHALAAELKVFVRCLERIPDTRETIVIAGAYECSPYKVHILFKALENLCRQRYYEKLCRNPFDAIYTDSK